jgi:hypothetical protein
VKTITYYLTEKYPDRNEWGPGPWEDEPDKKQWTDPETGLPCLIVRSAVGALCGYVGVPKTHALFEKDYDDAKVEVHGGLSFASRCDPGAEGDPYSGAICHRVEEGEDEDIWWLGFDCAHAFDATPALAHRLRKIGLPNPPEAYGRHMEYRDFAYVEEQVTQLAAQLKHIDLKELRV